MSQRNKILTGLLALQVVAIIAVFWPRSSGAEILQLIGGLEEPDVVSVTITDSEGNSIRIDRSPFGCVLREADDYPCAKDRLPDFLHRIVPLTTASLVTDSQASHARLKVADDDFERIIELELADGSRHKFYLGTSPRGRSGHARLDGQERVYLAPGLTAFDAPVAEASWVDPVYFSSPLDRVQTVTIANEDGTISLTKDEAGDWALHGDPPPQPLDQAKVNALVGKAATVRLTRPLGKTRLDSYGLDSPAATITLEKTGGERLILRIGAKLGGEGHVAKSETSEYYVVIDETAASDLIGQRLETLLETPKTPTPGGSN